MWEIVEMGELLFIHENAQTNNKCQLCAFEI